MTLRLEFEVDGAWLNVVDLSATCYVLGDPEGYSVVITRGEGNEQGEIAPQRIEWTMFDKNGTLDGENFGSPYWHKIGLGTPVRVVISDGFTDDIRCVGEIDSVEPRWDDGLENVVVDYTAAGSFQRLSGERDQPLKSVAYRALTAPENDTDRIAYWSVEEESQATRIWTPYTEQAYPTIEGTVSLGADTNSASSSRLAVLGSGGVVQFHPPGYSWGTQTKIITLFRYPEDQLPNNATVVRIWCWGGSLTHFDLVFGTGWSLRMNVYSVSTLVDTILGPTDWTAWIHDGAEVMTSIEFTQDGADLDVRLFQINIRNGLTGQVDDTVAASTLGKITSIHYGHGGNADGLAFGQVAVANSTTAFANYITHAVSGAQGARGYIDETSAFRLIRLGDEESIAINVLGGMTYFNTTPLGPQSPSAVFDLFQQAAATDDGLLYESRTIPEQLDHLPRRSMYNQLAVVNLTYAHLTSPFWPTTDNQATVNSVTATRVPDGSTVEYNIPDGDYYHWSTEPPPEGANKRPGHFDLNASDDDELPAHAAWRAHVASWREKRYRTVTLDLHRSVFTDEERTQVRSLELGNVIALDATGAPGWVPYTDLRLLVKGYVETINQVIHRFQFNCTSAYPYEVEVPDTGGSTLLAAIDADDTVIRIGTSLGPDWSVSDEPYHIQVGGQPMTVTAITTNTPAFIAVGTADHDVNASLTPGLPAGMTPDVGQLMLLFAAIRNSGIGTVNTPTGWSVVAQVSPQRNITVFGRYYVTGDAAPTVSFSGGVAGADTSAIIAGFSGLSMNVVNGLKSAPAAVSQLNSSAQDVAYPAIWIPEGRTGAAFIYAWKQDDNTAAGTPAGFTSLFRESTTLGDDQSITGRYDLTGATAVAGTVTQTGGAAAISRGMVFALRPSQTATVTRGISGTATSVAAGASIRIWREGANPL